jgi:hypothetical protein
MGEGKRGEERGRYVEQQQIKRRTSGSFGAVLNGLITNCGLFPASPLAVAEFSGICRGPPPEPESIVITRPSLKRKQVTSSGVFFLGLRFRVQKVLKNHIIILFDKFKKLYLHSHYLLSLKVYSFFGKEKEKECRRRS